MEIAGGDIKEAKKVWDEERKAALDTGKKASKTVYQQVMLLEKVEGCADANDEVSMHPQSGALDRAPLWVLLFRCGCVDMTLQGEVLIKKALCNLRRLSRGVKSVGDG